MSEWISVEDRLPDVDSFVIAYFSDDGVPSVLGVSEYIVECIRGDDYSPIWSSITHWMPLPEPPEQ